MSSGDSDIFLQQAVSFGILTIDAACSLTGGKPNTVTKELAKLTDMGRLVKEPFIHPRCFWHPHLPLGAQGLILASSVLYRCVVAEERIWRPEGRKGPATMIICGQEREALFVDYGASPRYVAKKLSRWCSQQDISEVTALGIVVPTEAKAQAINGAVEELPLPLRFTISADLWSLTCARARR